MVKDCIISHYNQLMKIVGALDFKMAASCFLSITQEVINRIKEHTILKSTENSTKFGIINDVKVLLIELNKTV